MTHPTKAQIKNFQQLVWDFYAKNKRDMPWRHPDSNGVYDPYKILVSEMMLQQTQVSRVVPKYVSFLELFPTINVLANASLADVLNTWSGLGYNRRAQYLHAAAQKLHSVSGAWTLEQLVACKGIGQNTAAAVCVYAYNLPLIFIETNIRTVMIKHFFSGIENVKDAEILEVVGQTLPVSASRDWYYALMDYGSYLKVHEKNYTIHAKFYTKQTNFNGSKRQIRGNVLKLLRHAPQTYLALHKEIKDNRLKDILLDLEKDGLIHIEKSQYFIG